MVSDFAENNDPSPSDSRSSSPSYTSPPLSPTPPRLSPQIVGHNAASMNGRDSPGSESDSKPTPEKEYDFEENVDPSIPDAKHWTPDEVAAYFTQKGFAEESKVFKEQVCLV